VAFSDSVRTAMSHSASSLKGLVPPPRATLAARKALGKALRERVPRRELGSWTVDRRRPHLVAQIRASALGRRSELLSLRWRRMMASPFAFFRSTAALMATDLGPVPTCGLEVQACGDAHLLNFAAQPEPDGRLVFDLNDFDETCRGAFEWDLKRLSASIVVAGRSVGQKDRVCAESVRWMARAFRESLDLFAEMRVLELARFEITPPSVDKPLPPIFHHAARQTPRQLLKKATRPDAEGFARFQRRPPFLQPLDHAEARVVLGALKRYRDNGGFGRRSELDAYAPWDCARKVSGTSRVGGDDFVVLLYGNGAGDPLFLQFTEQSATCWKAYLRDAKSYLIRYPHQGQRAAEGQFRTQTVEDPFLGWTRMDGKDLLVRQWSDHEDSLDVSMAVDGTLRDYAALCGQVLAKAHARTGDAAMLAGYCGGGDRLDNSMARFALAYADQAEEDYGRMRKALKSGLLG
jgi:uncharacterized protein (DUF2252 family)